MAAVCWSCPRGRAHSTAMNIDFITRKITVTMPGLKVKPTSAGWTVEYRLEV